MKIGKTKLRMSDGTIRHFKSEAARDAFERVANMVKAGVRLHVNHSGSGRKAKGTKRK